MTKEIELTQGKVALVDDDVFEWANKWKWHAARRGSHYYVARHSGTGPNQKTIYLHREIMNAPADMQVDHVDGNGLNCGRENMRLATHSENQRNTGLRSDNASGFKGVVWSKRSGKWMAQIKVNGKQVYIGLYDNTAAAARAYDEAALKYHGEFVRLNYPKGD